MRPLALSSVFLLSCAFGAHAQKPASAAHPDAGSDGGAFPDSSAGSPDAVASDEPTDASPGAQADFERALTARAQGNAAESQSLLKSLQQAPGKPFHNEVSTLLAWDALQSGATAEALTLTQTASGPNAKFIAALAMAYAGQNERAAEALQADQDPPNIRGIDAAQLRAARYLALARALAAQQRFSEAFVFLDQYANQGGKAERAFALRQADAIAAAMPTEGAASLFEKTDVPVAKAALGPRAAAFSARNGNTDEAANRQEQSATRRAAFAFSEQPNEAPWTGNGDPTRIGLALPLSGPALPLGLALARGATVAIGPAQKITGLAPFELVLRDANRPRDAAQVLGRQEAAIGVVGLADQKFLASTGRDGVPFLALSDAETLPDRAANAFQLIHTPNARIQSLVKAAVARGARTFAILRPNDVNGAHSGLSFSQAVKEAGGRVQGEVIYPPGQTTFSDDIKKLRGYRFDAIFVPEDADRLELIAPALAAGDIWPAPMNGGKSVPPTTGKKGAAVRPVLLLSTARGLSPRLLHNSHRYVQGALLAPGFYAAKYIPTAPTFVETFVNLFDAPPGASDAYGFDAAQILRMCVERGARTRAEVLGKLQNEEFSGVTGKIRFGAQGRRIDPALVYEVQGQDIVLSNPAN